MVARLMQLAARGVWLSNERKNRSRRMFRGSLAGLDVGDQGTVESVEGNTRLASRLRELGVGPGVRVRLLRAGGRLVVQVEDARFCLRMHDAAAVRLSPIT
ncbi:MAG: FeoA family protein [Gemmatimonadota bacterium]|nr:FeoA family protein [Gemmatimonadota bacterium]